MYADNPDPWSFATRWYDARKHALTVAALPRRRYRSAFEPGCSTGMLTQLLAARCDRLLAVDAVPAAARSAAERLADQAHVTVAVARMPDEWPTTPSLTEILAEQDTSLARYSPGEMFDLVVLSELGYYFDDGDLALLLGRAVGSLEPGGDLVAAHWRHPVAEHARDGDDVHKRLAAMPGLSRVARHEEEDFLLEVFTRVPPAAVSVAAREGLV